MTRKALAIGRRRDQGDASRRCGRRATSPSSAPRCRSSASCCAKAVDLRAGERVLDVAAGNGNATLAAARRFATVTSTDYVPALLERGRRRAEAEGLDGHVRSRRRRGAALSGRELRRRALDVRRDVRAGSRAGGPRADPGVPARRPDRPGVAGRRQGFLGDSSSRSVGAVRAADARAFGLRSCGAPTRTSRSCSPARRRLRTRRDISRSAIGRRSTGSRCSGATTDRCTRRSRRSTPERQAALERDLLALLRRADRGGAAGLVVPAEYLETVITR